MFRVQTKSPCRFKMKAKWHNNLVAIILEASLFPAPAFIGNAGKKEGYVYTS